MDYVRLGKQIRAARKRMKSTQANISEQADISLSFYGHIERGSRKASVETLLRIARALNVTVDTLLCDCLAPGAYGQALSEPGNYFEAIRKALDCLEMAYGKEKNRPSPREKNR